MENQGMTNFLMIITEILQIVLYLLAATAAYFFLNQEKIKELLFGYSKITFVILFIIITQILYMAGSNFIYDIIYFPQRISYGDSFSGVLNCLGSLLGLGVFVAGSVMILRKISTKY